MDFGPFFAQNTFWDVHFLDPGLPPPSFVFANDQLSSPYDLDTQTMEPWAGCSSEYASLCAVQQSVRLITQTKESVCDALAVKGVSRSTALAGFSAGRYSLEEAPGFRPFALSAEGEILAESLRPDLVGERLDGVLSSGYLAQPTLWEHIKWVVANGGGFVRHHSTRFAEALLSKATSADGDWVVSYMEGCPTGDVVAVSFRHEPLPRVSRCLQNSNALCAMQNIRSVTGAALVDFLISYRAEEFSQVVFDISYTDKYKVAGFYVSVYENSWLGYPSENPPVKDNDGISIAHGAIPWLIVGKNLTEWMSDPVLANSLAYKFNYAAWTGGGFFDYPWKDATRDNFTKVALSAGFVWNNTGFSVITGAEHTPDPIELGLSCEECSPFLSLPCSLVNTMTLIAHVWMQIANVNSNWDDISYDPWFGATGSLTRQTEHVGMWPRGLHVMAVDYNGTIVAAGLYQEKIGQNWTSVFPSWDLHLALVAFANKGNGWFSNLDSDRPSGTASMMYVAKVRKSHHSSYLVSFMTKAWGPWDSSCKAEYVSNCSNRNTQVIVGAAAGDILASSDAATRILAFEDIALRQGPYAPSKTRDFRVYVYNSSWLCHEDFLLAPSLGSAACPPALSHGAIAELESLADDQPFGWVEIPWTHDGDVFAYAFLNRIRWKASESIGEEEELFLLSLVTRKPSPAACNTTANCPANSTCHADDGLCHCSPGFSRNITVVDSDCGGWLSSEMTCVPTAGLNCLASDGSTSWASCRPCGAGCFCPSGIPVLCPAGQYCPEKSVSPVPCQKGTFGASSGRSACDLCPIGTASSAAGADSCSSCLAGTFSSSTGQTSCTVCPIGSYNNDTEVEHCHACPGGTFTASTGATALTACRLCRDDYFFDAAGLKCQACAWGSSSESQTDQECQIRSDLLSLGLGVLVLLLSTTIVVSLVLRRYRRRMQVLMEKESKNLEATVDAVIESLQDFSLPMVVMSSELFQELTIDDLRLGHEGNRDAHRLTWMDSLADLQERQEKEGTKVVMFSYAKSHSLRALALPTAAQLAGMQSALKEVILQQSWLDVPIFVWLDVLSIPKDLGSVQELAQQSMYLYIKSVDAFVVVTASSANGPTLHSSDFPSPAKIGDDIARCPPNEVKSNFDGNSIFWDLSEGLLEELSFREEQGEEEQEKLEEEEGQQNEEQQHQQQQQQQQQQQHQQRQPLTEEGQGRRAGAGAGAEQAAAKSIELEKYERQLQCRAMLLMRGCCGQNSEKVYIWADSLHYPSPDWIASLVDVFGRGVTCCRTRRSDTAHACERLSWVFPFLAMYYDALAPTSDEQSEARQLFHDSVLPRKDELFPSTSVCGAYSSGRPTKRPLFGDLLKRIHLRLIEASHHLPRKRRPSLS